MPRLQMIRVDGDVLIFTVAVTILSAALFGLAPAVRLARGGVAGTLKESGRAIAGLANQRMRRGLAAAQVALAFVLAVSSGLLLRSFVSILTTNPGFVADGVLTASVELPSARYPNSTVGAFYRRARERLAALPGVRAVAFSSDLPWTGYDENTGFDIVGRARDTQGPEARYHFITPGYLRATGTPLVAGRELTPSDGAEAPRVVLLNESAARKYWATPGAAVGATLELWGEERTVAGVIGDVRDMPWHERAAPALYFPHEQQAQSRMLLLLRADGDLSSIVPAIRRALGEMDPELPLAEVRPLDAVANAAIATRRLTLWLVGAFGTTALLLAVVGIYGVMAQAVGQRRHEFAVRQALGATRAEIARMVLSSAAVIAFSGLTVGLLLALLATRLLDSLLYGVTAIDPATFATVAAVLLVAAAAASYLPARRATTISTAAALREG
jgi:putative ABC transport system permease protein